jgi:hypothetical protein
LQTFDQGLPSVMGREFPIPQLVQGIAHPVPLIPLHSRHPAVVQDVHLPMVQPLIYGPPQAVILPRPPALPLVTPNFATRMPIDDEEREEEWDNLWGDEWK